MASTAVSTTPDLYVTSPATDRQDKAATLPRSTKLTKKSQQPVSNSNVTQEMTEKPTTPPEDHSSKLNGKLATLPSLLADKVKSTQSKQIESGELMNLTFLSEEERSTILKVIQADLKLRRSTLGALKKSIDKSQAEGQPENTVEAGPNKPGVCAYCRNEISMICSRIMAGKCSICGKLICKRCTGKQTHDLTVLCLSCKNRRMLSLQTLDYESILRYGVGEDRLAEEGPALAESELVKKSLQAAMSLTRPRKSVEFSDHTKQGASRSGTLSRASASEGSSSHSRNRLQLKAIGKSSSLEIRDPPIHSPEMRSSSAIGYSKGLTIPSIDDPNSGFHLVSKSSDESLVDLCSVYSEQCYFGVEITGRILIGIWYKAEEKRLYIRIVKAEKLAEAADGALDPYVKTYLLPGIYKSNKRKTGLQYDTTKPVWNEILKYANLTHEEVSNRTVWVSVWDWNRYGRQQFLGEVQIPLSTRDLTNSKDEWFQLQDSENKPSAIEEVDSPEQQTRPRVLVATMFKPYDEDELGKLRHDKKNGTLGCLHIKIRRAENLPAMDINDHTDSFVRCYLLPNRQLGGKKKSKVVENSLNPVWEDEMIYTYLSLEELQCERVLEVTVWDYDRRGTNQFIGGVRIGPNPFDVIHSYDWMDSTDSESIHWEDMLDKPGEWVETWQTLRPSMDSIHQLKQKLHIRQGSALSEVAIPGMDSLQNNDRHSPIISTPVHQKGDESLEVNISRPKKGHYKITGEILIGIKYIEGFLYLKVIKASGLTAVHRNGVSNPYVKTYLLPDRSKESKKKTVVKRGTLDPVYKEVFKYKVDSADIQNRILWVTVWDQGSFGANHFMGETCISMSGNLRHSTERWYELHDFAESGMVVMATPFGHTPTPNHSYTSTEPNSLESGEESPTHQSHSLEDQHQEGSSAHKQSHDSDKPTPSVQDEGVDEPDVASHGQGMPVIPTVNIEDFETSGHI